MMISVHLAHTIQCMKQFNDVKTQLDGSRRSALMGNEAEK